MRYYETLYIVNPNYELERLEAVMNTVGSVLEKADKVTVINHRTWGKKRLAYPIEKHKYGTYILLQFELDAPEFLAELDQFLKLEKAIIRHQTIRLETRPEVYVEPTDEPVAEKKPEETSEKDTSPAEETKSEEPVAEETNDESEAEPSTSDEEQE
ncbi:MAG: 30S ribosomal protein S6 [FCB group bacterium]|nr:30S ribosomal protein S6 [FCB group bacterium]